MKYDHIIRDAITCRVSLSRRQQEAILTAHDDGLSNLSRDQIKELERLINTLKDMIWP